MITSIVTVILMLVSVPIIYAVQRLTYAVKYKRTDDSVRIYSSKKLIRATQIFAAIMYGMTVVVGVSLLCARLSELAILLPTMILYLFSLMAACDATRIQYKHVLLEDDSLTVVYIYKKDKQVKYSDIAYYVASETMLQRHRLKCDDIVYECYDSADKKLCAVCAALEQICKFTNKMTELDIPLKGYSKEYIGKQNAIGKVVALALCSVLFFGMFGLMYGIAEKPKEFQNYPVRGTVESYYVANSGSYPDLYITLKNDDNRYYVTNAIYNIKDDNIVPALKTGTRISMLIAYQDDGKYVVSQIEIDGKVYLSADKAEYAVQSNYTSGQIAAYVVLAIGVAWLFFTVIYGFKTIKRI